MHSAQRFVRNPLRRAAASEWASRAEFESARFCSSSAETRCPPRGGDSTNIRRETSGTGGAWPLPALPQVTRGGTLLRGMNWAGGGRILRGISVARGGEAAHAAHGHEGAGSGFQLWIGSASGDEDRGFDSNKRPTGHLNRRRNPGLRLFWCAFFLLSGYFVSCDGVPQITHICRCWGTLIKYL